MRFTPGARHSITVACAAEIGECLSCSVEIRVVQQDALQHGPGAISVAKRAKAVREIHANLTEMRVVRERSPPEFDRAREHAAAGVEDAQVVGNDGAILVHCKGPLIVAQGEVTVASSLIEKTQSREHLGVVRTFSLRLFEQSQGFACGKRIAAQSDLSVGESQIARFRLRVAELNQLPTSYLRRAIR